RYLVLVLLMHAITRPVLLVPHHYVSGYRLSLSVISDYQFLQYFVPSVLSHRTICLLHLLSHRFLRQVLVNVLPSAFCFHVDDETSHEVFPIHLNLFHNVVGCRQLLDNLHKKTQYLILVLHCSILYSTFGRHSSFRALFYLVPLSLLLIALFGIDTFQFPYMPPVNLHHSENFLSPVLLRQFFLLSGKSLLVHPQLHLLIVRFQYLTKLFVPLDAVSALFYQYSALYRLEQRVLQASLIDTSHPSSRRSSLLHRYLLPKYFVTLPLFFQPVRPHRHRHLVVSNRLTYVPSVVD